MKSILSVALILVVLDFAHSDTFADGDENSAPATRGTANEVGLFEQCTLVVKQVGENISHRQRLKLVQNNESAVIYETAVDNVKLRLIHANGKLAKFKESQTLKWDREVEKHFDDLERDAIDLVGRKNSHKEYQAALPAKIREVEERISRLERDGFSKRFIDEERTSLKKLKASLGEAEPSLPKRETPSDSEVNAYWHFEVLVDNDDLYTMHIYNDESNAYADQFMKAKISNEKELFNSQVNQENGRLGWKTSNDGFVPSSTAYSVNCNSGI